MNNNLQQEIIDKVRLNDWSALRKKEFQTARDEINDMWLMKKGKCNDGRRKKFFMEYGEKEMAKKIKYIKPKEHQGMWKTVVEFIKESRSSILWNLGKTLKFFHVL